MDETNRVLHFLQSVSTRNETLDGKEYLVAPVVALVQGVVYPLGAKKPELAAAKAFTKAPTGWNDKPLFLGHPMVDGKPVLGCTPQVLSRSVGRIFNTKVDGPRLLMEAWIDVEKAKSTEEGRSLLDRVKTGKKVEVSTGLLVRVEDEEGEYEGERYSSVWRETFPDHLALLNEKEEGACSYAAGCGIRAAQRYQITDTGFEPVKEKRSVLAFLKDLLATDPDDAKLATMESELAALKGAEFSAKNKSKIQGIHDSIVALGAQCGDARAMSGHPCKCQEHKTMKKEERVKALIADKRSPFDEKDEARLLQASDEQLTRFEAAASKNKAGSGALLKSIIDKIIANDDLPFTEDDRSWLEEASEDRLVEFAGWSAGDDKTPASDDGKGAAGDKTGGDKAGKGTDAKGQTNPDGTPKQMTGGKVKTEAEFLAEAPQSIRDLVEKQKKQDEATRNRLVALAKGKQTEYTEDELKAMPLEQLTRFCRAAGFLRADASFEGQGLPVDDHKPATAEPPNGYRIALDARKAAETAAKK